MPRGNASFPASRTFSPVPVHPDEHLREDFLQPLGLSVNALAIALCVPATRILGIVNRKCRVSSDGSSACPLFQDVPEFWLTLQTHYDLAVAERESLPAITREVLPCEDLNRS